MYNNAMRLSSGQRVITPSSFVGILLFIAGLCGSGNATAQTNVALSAVATHSGGGVTTFAATNYNDGVIAAHSGCTSTAQPWGWVTGGGSITYTWSSAVTFDKIVLYKSNRPMTACQMQYWDGSAYVAFLNYTGGTCSQDSVTFSSINTTRLRFLSVTGSNPNHREIQVWLSAPPAPSVTGATTYCAGGTISLSATSSASSPTFNWTGWLLSIGSHYQYSFYNNCKCRCL